MGIFNFNNLIQVNLCLLVQGPNTGSNTLQGSLSLGTWYTAVRYWKPVFSFGNCKLVSLPWDENYIFLFFRRKSIYFSTSILEP